MRRKIVTVIIVGSLLITQFAGIPVVFSDEIQGVKPTEQLEESMIQSSEKTITDNVLKEPIVQSNENVIVEETNTFSFEDDIVKEETFETGIEEITTTSSEIEELEESITDSSVSTEVVESSEELQYEEVFYNNQTFKFPIQKETEESENDLNSNHKLSELVESTSDITPIITDKQTERPRWDFISVSSEDGQLSIEEYEAMKKVGVTGVVVKLTEGSYYKNPFAQIQIENAQQAGLKVSTYHISRYTTKQGSEKEAAYYAAEAKRLNLSEDTTMVNGLGGKFNNYSTQNAIFFSNKLKELGFNQTIHYSSVSSFSNGALSMTILGENYSWIADYSSAPTNSGLLHTENAAWQWSEKMHFTDIPGKEFDVSIDYFGTFSNPIEIIIEDTESIKNTKIDTVKEINKYGTITSKEFSFWKDLDLKKENAKSRDYFRKTLYLEKEITLTDGSKYFLVKDNKEKTLGYIDIAGVKVANGEQGELNRINQFVTIKGTSPIWGSFKWNQNHSASKYKNKTVKAKGIYYHFSGANYLSLYDNQDNWLGYINENGTKNGQGEQGSFNAINQFVTIKGTSPIWGSFKWNQNHSASKYKNKTVKAKGIYYHFSGASYLSLYDNKNNWLGYINENGTKGAQGEQGSFNNIDRFVTIKGTSPIWSSFNWNQNHSASKYKNKTVKAKGIYYHFSGASYLSLYDNKNNWLGYINENGTKESSGEQGAHHSDGRYVSINGTHDIWDGFPLKNKKTSRKYQGYVFESRGLYYHFDGVTYLSLYDSKGGWLGYINKDGTKNVTSVQGDYQKYNKYVTVKSNNEAVYRNFNWALQQVGEIGKETFQAKGVYHHFNGNRYFSIYDLNNKWIGYISEHSVDEKVTHLFVMGHGANDPGAVGSGTSEREFTRNELFPYLQKYAKKLKKSEVIFYDVSRNLYTDSKNKQGLHNIHAGLSSITELHLDAAGIGATGGHVIVHPKKKSYKEDLELANVVKKYNGLWGGVTKTKGLSYRQDLLNLNVSHDYDISYRLVEMGFITNYKDVVKLRLNLDKIAKEFIEVVTGEKI